MTEPGRSDTPYLFRERARIVAVEDGCAVLEALRASGCGACATRSACGTGALARGLLGGPVRLRATLTADAAVGEEVTLTVRASTLRHAAFAAYMIPALALAGAAALGVAFRLSDGATALLAAIALGSAFAHLGRVGAAAGAGVEPTIDDANETGMRPCPSTNDRPTRAGPLSPAS
ncbi:MAG: SoxR reducing system RseC family protein [Roseicyclus sp.]